MTQPDAELIRATQDGDREAFARLVERYQGRVYSLAVHLLGDREEGRDVAQEVFIKIYRSLSGFRPGGEFTPWLFAITANTARDHWRRKNRREETAGSGSVELERAAGTYPAPEQIWERKETRETVIREVTHLPWEYRTVVILRHFQELSYGEIAEVLQLPVNTVKTRLRRGRIMLKERLAPLLEQRGENNER